MVIKLKVIVVVGILYIFLIFIVVFTKSNKLDVLNRQIEQRGKIVGLLTTICFSLVLAVALDNRSNKIAEEQVNIADRETSPEFQLERSGKNQYIVTGQKGMASYITLTMYEHYYFTYHDEQYEMNLTFEGNEVDGKMNMDSQNRKLLFQLQKDGFDKEKAYASVKEYVKEYLKEDVDVYCDEYIKLSFFDYKNERFTFQFDEYGGKIQLVSTDDTKYVAPHNITGIYWGKGSPVESQLKSLVEGVIKEE